jgi:hypothetical protein
MENAELDYPTGKRLLAGVLWGSLWGGGLCGIVLSVIPVGPQGFFLAIFVLFSAMGVGISLHWNAAREACHECGATVTATASGGQCPACGQRYRAVERKLVKR